ncbi:hypothetical protein CDD83_8598 [Cordyceps sp. RAO-2017]|nr:hypothetical protein CDD83_8598 [Cordyceps sp. RAO-2017]
MHASAPVGLDMAPHSSPKLPCLRGASMAHGRCQRRRFHVGRARGGGRERIAGVVALRAKDKVGARAYRTYNQGRRWHRKDQTARRSPCFFCMRRTGYIHTYIHSLSRAQGTASRCTPSSSASNGPGPCLPKPRLRAVRPALSMPALNPPPSPLPLSATRDESDRPATDARPDRAEEFQRPRVQQRPRQAVARRLGT